MNDKPEEPDVPEDEAGDATPDDEPTSEEPPPGNRSRGIQDLNFDFVISPGLEKTLESMRIVSGQIQKTMEDSGIANFIGSRRALNKAATPLSDLYAASLEERWVTPARDSAAKADTETDPLPALETPTPLEILRGAHLGAQLALIESIRNRAMSGLADGYELQALTAAYLTLPSPDEDFDNPDEQSEDGH